MNEDIEIAYAKVNLALHVRACRSDGYHELESLFVFAEDGDHLQGHSTDDGMIRLTLDGPFGAGLAVGTDNLVVRAGMALQDFLGERRGALLHLTKNLPIASGIGGGSADAAAALRLLTRLWDSRIERKEMEALALSIGSDVPACLDSMTRLVRGRGELLEDLAVEGLADRPMLLVNPGVALSTGQVFAGWDGVDRGALSVASPRQLQREARNDLEASAVREAPVIAEVLDALGQCGGVLLARMSGSGATCFALFERESDMRIAANTLRHRESGWWIMETRIRTA